ncbi:MAG: FG-GAP repeat domain-containing protein [Deltaproteobacteria bacterium]
MTLRPFATWLLPLAACAPAIAPFTGQSPKVIGSGLTSVCAADFNGDGHLDLAAVATGGLSVLLGDGKGGLSAPHLYASLILGDSLSQLVAADVNGDGKPDLLATASAGIDVFLNQDGHGFAQANPVSAPGATGVPVVADFNGDGKADLAVPLSSDSIGLLLGNGDGTFAAMQVVQASNTPTTDTVTAIAVGDLSGDGKPDLAVLLATAVGITNVSQGDALVILTNQGGGTFSASKDAFLGDGSGVATASTVMIGDLNGDGKLDVVVGADLVPQTSTQPTDPNGGFTGSSTPVAPIAQPVQQSGELFVALGHGDGTLASFQSYGVPTNADSVALASGWAATGGTAPSLLFGGKQLGSVDTLPASTDGPDGLTGEQGTLVLSGDFNGDGKPDVVVMDPTPGTVQILLAK